VRACQPGPPLVAWLLAGWLALLAGWLACLPACWLPAAVPLRIGF